MPISWVVLPGAKFSRYVTQVCGCTYGNTACSRACIGHASLWHAGHARALRAALPSCGCPWWHALPAHAMGPAAPLHHSLMRRASTCMSDISPGHAAFWELLWCVYSVQLASPEFNHRSVQPLQRCVGVCVCARPGIAAHARRSCRSILLTCAALARRGLSLS